MTISKLITATAFALGTASMASALDLMPSSTPTAPDMNSVPNISVPVAPTPSPTVIFPVPTTNGGVMIGGQHDGVGGVITHQPHGGGYTTNGGLIGNNDLYGGGSVTTGPNGAPIGGGVTIGGSF